MEYAIFVDTTAWIQKAAARTLRINIDEALLLLTNWL